MLSTSIILASSSKYRRAQLEALGLVIPGIAPNIDETPIPGEHPETLARRLAEQKATHIAEQYPNAVVIGSDQVACVETDEGVQLLGKPHTRDNAVNQLSLCSGKKVTFYTGLSLCKHQVRTLTHCETVEVQFRALSRQQIEAYIDREQPFDCAGSFKSEGLGVLLFEHIHSRDPNTLIGLPVMLLRDMLADFDIDLLEMATALD